jgi:hypothetical protein
LAGKRIAAAGFGNLTSYEIQFLIERYHLGPQTTIVSAPSSTDRLIALQTRLAEAAIVASPLDLKGEEIGLKRLLHMGTILQIPQAGLAATVYYFFVASSFAVSAKLPSAAIFDFSLASAAPAVAASMAI